MRRDYHESFIYWRYRRQRRQKAVREYCLHLKIKYNPHIIIANGENAAGGRGITAAIARELFEWGVHGITMGNHTWDNREIFEFIDDEAAH